MTTSWIKDPDAVLDYTFNWTTWLADASDEIVSYEVFADGVTVDSHFRIDGQVTAWVSGGTVGATATVTNRIVTSAGRTEDRTIKLFIRDR